MSNIKAARALGWASIAVGATELIATRWLQREMGVKGHDTLIRAFGLREIGAGVAILSQAGISQGLATSLWSRVAGDALDIAALAAAAQYTRKPEGLGAIMALVLGITGLDVVVAARVQQDVARAKRLSTAARKRVQPTSAKPLGAVAVEQSAVPQAY